jgi:hypothetical protein
MINDPIDKYFGIPLSEWIDKTPNELEVDAVGLWQIIPVGKDGFNLSGTALEEFTKRSIVALINRGAVPVRSLPAKDGFWEKQFQYGNLPNEIANKIIEEWRTSGVDPDHDGIWFSIIADKLS